MRNEGMFWSHRASKDYQSNHKFHVLYGTSPTFLYLTKFDTVCKVVSLPGLLKPVQVLVSCSIDWVTLANNKPLFFPPPLFPPYQRHKVHLTYTISCLKPQPKVALLSLPSLYPQLSHPSLSFYTLFLTDTLTCFPLPFFFIIPPQQFVCSG